VLARRMIEERAVASKEGVAAREHSTMPPARAA
jgi:hypothetical protein